MRPSLPPLFRAALVATLAAAALAGLPAQADTGTSSGLGSPARANLRFAVNIDKFVYLRLGNSGNGINNIAFNLTPTIPAAGTAPAGGNALAANWNGTAPGVTVASSTNALPVEVKSNGGSVTLRANIDSALTSGGRTIPMSQISVTSSDNNLPPPPLNGSSTTSVLATGFGGRVADQSATWTFTFTPTTIPVAGTYTGQISFTATSL